MIQVRFASEGIRPSRLRLAQNRALKAVAA